MKIGKNKIISVVDKLMEYSFYGLIFFIPISKAGIESLFGILLFLFLIKKFLRPDFKFLRHPLYYSLLFFVVFNALSLFNSGPYLKKSVMALFLKWLEYIFMFIIARDGLADKRRIRNAVIVFLCAGFLVSVDGIFQFFTKSDFLRQRGLVHVANYLYAVTASFQHYNDFGTYLVIVFAMTAAFLLKQRNKGLSQISLWVIILLSEICLLMTFSRGSWLNFFVVLILLLIMSRRVELIYMAGIFVIAFIFMPIAKDRIMMSFFPKGDADRFIVWHAAFNMIKEHPFLGKGVGTFMAYFRDYVNNRNIQYAHNCFLQIWAETGIFSLVSFLSFLGFLLWGGIVAFAKSRNFIILGLVSGLFGFLVHSFFDTQFYSLQLATLFWLMGGLLQAMAENENRIIKGSG